MRILMSLLLTPGMSARTLYMPSTSVTSTRMSMAAFSKSARMGAMKRLNMDSNGSLKLVSNKRGSNKRRLLMMDTSE